MPDANGNPTPEEQLLLQQYARDTEQFIEAGREANGPQQFDEAANDVVASLGGNPHALNLQLQALDHGPEVLMHLSRNPDQIEKFKKLPPARQFAMLTSIQTQLCPRGVANISNDAAWRPRGGKPESYREKSTWLGGRNYPSDETGDRNWNADFDRHMARRAKERSGR
jgi:hypothetical protein